MSRLSLCLMSCVVGLASLSGPAARALQASPGAGAGEAAAGTGHEATPGEAHRWGRTDPTAASQDTSPIVSAAQLVGATLRSADGRTLGSVADLGVDARDGLVLFVAIDSPRESIGIANRMTALPLHRIGRTPDGLVLTGVSRARFAGAVKFSPDLWPDPADVAAYAVWTGTVWKAFDEQPTWNDRSSYERPSLFDRVPLGEEGGSADDEAREREAKLTREELAAIEAAAAASEVNRPQGVRASALENADLFDAQSQRCGRVRALCFDLRTSHLAYVLVEPRDASGKPVVTDGGDVLRPVPWRLLDCQYAGDRLYASLSHEQFEKAPSFPADTWPDLASPEWQQKLDACYPPPTTAPTTVPAEAPADAAKPAAPQDAGSASAPGAGEPPH